MLKCDDKFCSNNEVKDTQECRNSKKNNHPTWSGACFWQREGFGCEDCGGKVVRTSGCYVCVECGYSPCG